MFMLAPSAYSVVESCSVLVRNHTSSSEFWNVVVMLNLSKDRLSQAVFWTS